MEKFLLELFLVVIVLFVVITISLLTAKKCPTCESRRVYYRHQKKNGGADLRYKFNPLICEDCIAAKKINNHCAVPEKSSEQKSYDELKSRFKDGDWVVFENPHQKSVGANVKSIFTVYIDKNGRLQPFTNLNDTGPSAYRLATELEVQKARVRSPTAPV